MSVEVMSLAWYVGGLTPAQKAILVALADHANEQGKHVYPSVERLVYKTSYAERTVRRALSDLREMRLIVVVREATYHKPTEYRLDLSEMQARQERPATDAAHDLPERQPSEDRPARDAGHDLPESAARPARNAPKPSVEPPKEPKEDDGDRAREAAEGAALELLDFWQDLTGSFAPAHEERRALDYIGPLNRLWIRVGRDLEEAKRLLRAKRDEMLGQGKTPFRPAAIVPAIFAELDGAQPRASPNGNHDPRAGEQPESDPTNWKPVDEYGAAF